MGLFDKFSSTTTAKSRLKPLVVKMFADDAKNIALQYFKDNNYKNITNNDDYLDLYGERNGYEVSLEFTKNGSSTIVNVSVFGENKIGRTSFALKRIYKDLIDIYACSSSEEDIWHITNF